MEMVWTALLMVGGVLGGVVWLAWLWDQGDRAARQEALAAAEAAHGADFSRVIWGGRCGLAYDPARRLLCAVGPRLSGAVVVSVDQVIGVEVGSSEVHLPPPRKSALGRAVVGGVLFGGAGAVVGAASAISDGGSGEIPYFYLHLFTEHPDLPHHALMFNRLEDAQDGRGRILQLLGRGASA